MLLTCPSGICDIFPSWRARGHATRGIYHISPRSRPITLTYNELSSYLCDSSCLGVASLVYPVFSHNDTEPLLLSPLLVTRAVKARSMAGQTDILLISPGRGEGQRVVKCALNPGFGLVKFLQYPGVRGAGIAID